jgi:hypothetical protein
MPDTEWENDEKNTSWGTSAKVERDVLIGQY